MCSFWRWGEEEGRAKGGQSLREAAAAAALAQLFGVRGVEGEAMNRNRNGVVGGFRFGVATGTEKGK